VSTRDIVRDEDGQTGDPLRQVTRLVLGLGVGLTVGTGVGLWLLPRSTETFWAWVIKAPLSAAFLGAGYAGAAVSLFLALRSGRWALARSSLLSAFVLTTIALVATVRYRDTFLLGGGDALPRTIAWVWLVVYVALPPLVLLSFAAQQRAGGAREPRTTPLAPASAAALALAGVAVGVPGILLLAGWDTLVDAWPWPLAPLPAVLVGGWLVTAAVTLLWLGVAERDWARARPSLAGAAVFGTLLLAAAVRLRSDVERGTASVIYVAGIAAFLLLLGAVSLAERRRERRPGGEPRRSGA
jgi:hypothetical protein